jgi:hypothetical protein
MMMAVSGDLEAPRSPEWRISDADRERVAVRLRAGLAEGRLTTEEFTERMATVSSAVRYADVEPLLTDLPGGPLSAPPKEHAELRTTFNSLKRRGAWVVPRRLKITSIAGTVKLDFTETVIAHPVVDIDINVWFASTVLVVPEGASADIDGVDLVASPGKLIGVPSSPGLGPHFVVRGHQVVGSLVVRHRRHLGRLGW